MNSLNNTLIHHWPFPQKQTQKKPAALKKETAYRLGVKFPSDLELDSRIPLSKSSRHNLLKSKYAKTLATQKVTESCSTIDNFHTPSSLKHHQCGGRALGAVPDRNSEPVTTKATVIRPSDALPLSSSSRIADDCQLSLSQLRTLFTPSSATKVSPAAKPSQSDSPTYCPMNPYRMVYNSTLSSAHLLLNLKRQQELINRLNSTHQLKHHVPSLAVTSSRHSGNLAKSKMTLNSCSHITVPDPSHILATSAANEYCHPPPPQTLSWRSKSEVLQLPAVESATVTSTPSVAAVTTTSSRTTTHIPCTSRRPAKPLKKHEPAKYADPWKGGGRLYRKRLSDLAAMVTETLIWEKSKQHKKGKQGSNSTL